MSRLTNFGTGEITDRLTILSLKILYGQDAGKPVDHFVAEQNQLLPMIKGRTLNGIWFEHALALAAVNGALWQAEDQLRLWRASAGNGHALEQVLGNAEPILRLAFRIQDLNDRRAALISAINAHTGEKLGEEKI